MATRKTPAKTPKAMKTAKTSKVATTVKTAKSARAATIARTARATPTVKKAKAPAAKSAAAPAGATGAPKTRPGSGSVADFIAAVPDAQQRADAQTVLAMMRAATGCEAVLWGTSIVGFDRYHYRYDSGREGDMPIVGFSPRKASLVLYVMPGFARYDALLARLGKHDTGKSCLYVKRLADVDLDVLDALIRDSVAWMRQKYPSA